MKIMLISPYYFPYIGGLENYVMNLANGLKRDGHEVIIVTSKHLETDADESVHEGIRIYKLSPLFTISNTPINPLWYWKLRRIIRHHKPDVINGHTPVPFLTDMAALACKDIPFVLTYHNDIVKDSILQRIIIKIYYVLILNRTLAKAQKIIVTSELYAMTSRHLSKMKHKVLIAPPGVDSRFFKLKDRRKSSKISCGEYFLFVGKINFTHKHKGGELLLGAFKNILAHSPHIQLVCIIPSADKAYVDSLLHQLGIAQNVRVLENVTNVELASYYQNALATILPSTNDAEGFGMVLAESQVCGTPIIATDAGGIKEAFFDQKSGILIKKNSSKALVQAMKEITVNNNFRNHLLEKHQQVIKKYSWSKTTNIHEKAYEDSQNITVVHVIPHYPPFIGGMELRVAELSKRLVQSGKNVIVLTSNQRSHTAHELQDGVQVNYLPSVEIFHTPIIFGLVRHLVRIKNKNLVIHVHIAQALTPEIASFIARMRRIPYIAHIRLDIPPSTLIGKICLPTYKKLFLNPVLRGAAKVIVLTDDYKNLVHEKYGIPIEKIVVIPNATDLEIASRPKQFPKHGKKILYVGRLSKQKNVALLLDAIHNYYETYKDPFSVDIVGDGELRQQLEDQAAEMNLTNTVKFHGEITGSKLESFYEAADLFVLTSTHEAFGTVLIEAMAKGLPIVTTNITAVRNVVIHMRNGLLVDPSAEAISSAIHDILKDDRLYHNLSVNNIQDAKHYEWNDVVQKTERVYDAVLL